MNYFIGSHITILILLLTSCSQPAKKSTSATIDSVDKEVVIDAILNPNDSVVINPNQYLYSYLSKLKKLVSDEYSKNKSPDSLIFSNSDSIGKFAYIVDMFPLEKLDSIEFVGIFNKHKVSHKYLTMNSLLILYFNDRRTSQQELDSLEINYKKNFRATESMFKPGGIAFEIDNQLVVYSLNTCGPGYKNLQRIDALIKHNVFEGTSFSRLHAKCGMGPFKRIEE